jgi:hypothetical protein
MADPSGSSLADVASFLRRLEEARIHYTLASAREGAVMVQVAVPGERWEIEFFPNHPPEIEVFRSGSSIGGAALLEQLFNEHGDYGSASARTDTT